MTSINLAGLIAAETIMEIAEKYPDFVEFVAETLISLQSAQGLLKDILGEYELALQLTRGYQVHKRQEYQYKIDKIRKVLGYETQKVAGDPQNNEVPGDSGDALPTE